MSSVLAGKTILVTGGTGSIGSEIVKQALEQGATEVIVFSRDEIKHFMMRKNISNDRLETVVGDVRDLRSVEQVFNRFDIDLIYHAAAMKHVVMCEDFPLEAVKTNILGTQNVVDIALKYEIPQMITISTDKAAYPVNVMGAAKFIAEKITLNGNLLSKGKQAFSCIRFGNVANSRGSVIPVYIENLLNRKPLQVTDLEVTRFIMEISDAVKLIIKATEYGQGGEIFILKMKAFKLGDLVDVIVNRIAPRLNMAKDDIKVNVTGLVSGEKLHEDLINNTESSRVYELENMYVLLPDHESSARIPSISKASLTRYTSNDVGLISRERIEQTAIKYLESLSRLQD
jgi:UDP-N-acetylglucosamine 4,6-dehydratase/5-epimerase